MEQTKANDKPASKKVTSLDDFKKRSKTTDSQSKKKSQKKLVLFNLNQEKDLS